MVDVTKIIFSSDVEYDKVRRSGETSTTFTGSSTWRTIVDFSDLGLTRPPKVYIIFNSGGGTTWKLPGGGTYFNGRRAPIIRVTPTAIQAQDGHALDGVYNFKYWILDTSMKAN